MDKLVIEGGRALKGTVQISGAKNACLPILAAALLSDERSVIRNVPALSLATSSASPETSEATILQSVISFVKAIAIFPEPVQRSSIEYWVLSIELDKAIAVCTKISVSGRGINTRSSTIKSNPQNLVLPIIYCTGVYGSTVFILPPPA